MVRLAERSFTRHALAVWAQFFQSLRGSGKRSHPADYGIDAALRLDRMIKARGQESGFEDGLGRGVVRWVEEYTVCVSSHTRASKRRRNPPEQKVGRARRAVRQDGILSWPRYLQNRQARERAASFT